jgi:hypothetical protein
MMTPKQLTGELDARLDGPHDDDHTTAAADLAAECIRFLNYATGSHSPAGLVYPATAYMIAADLSSAAHRMVQLFGQLANWLEREDAAGMLGTDDGAPSADVVALASIRLAEAAAAARHLSARLAALQNDIAGLNGRGPNRQTGGA